MKVRQAIVDGILHVSWDNEHGGATPLSEWKIRDHGLDVSIGIDLSESFLDKWFYSDRRATDHHGRKALFADDDGGDDNAED